MHLLTLLPRFRRAYRALEGLAAVESWSRDDLERLQLERLNAVWGHAVRHVPHYRGLATTQQLPERFDSLDQFTASVPILPKRTVRADRMTLVSERPAPGTWRFTGGSTGAVTRVYCEHEAHRARLQVKYRHSAMWGVDFLDRTAFLWGHGASFAPGWRGQVGRLRRPVEDRLRNRLRLSAYDLSSPVLSSYLRRLASFQPRSLYAYSTAAWLLAKQAVTDGASVDSLRYVMLTAEPACPHIVANVERAFNVPAIKEYGSIECGVLAVEWPDRTLRVREDLSMIETIERDDGRFDIVVTVLGNASFPLFRYHIGDVTDRAIVFPDSGFAVLNQIEGRENDLVVSRSGRMLHPLWFDDLFENTRGTRRWRVYQDAAGAVSVEVELEPGAQGIDERQIARAIESHLDGFPVSVATVSRVTQNAAGKHRWVSSDLARDHLAAQTHAA